MRGIGFNEKLQGLRKEKGLPQKGLVELIGVSRRSVAKWESKKSYSEVDKLIQLSNVFGVSIGKLLKNIEEECCNKEIEKSIDGIDGKVVDFLRRAKKLTYVGGDNESQSF